MNLGIIVLIISIILFALLAFKRISALILAPLISIFVLVLSRMPVLESLKGSFMPVAADYVSKYFLIFFVGALFGAVYQFTGAGESIALLIAKASKGKFVAPIIMTITGILTYGGISGFVVFFVVYPIAVQLFKKADITRRLMPAAISAGCWAWSMSGPGAPSIPNVIASENLGTPANTVLVPSVIATVLMYALIFIWLEYRTKKFKKKNILFEDDTLTYQLTSEELAYNSDKELPNGFLSFVPIIVILFCYNFLGLAVELSVTIGVLLSVVLFFNKVDSLDEWIKIFNKGAADSGVAILNTAIIVGFGGVVQQTKGFADLVQSLEKFNLSPLIFVMITVTICAGICGSASGGIGIAFNALGEKYLSLGVNLGYVHRVATMSAGILGTLPHQGAQITLLNICKMTHKETYYDIAITQMAIPLIVVFVFIGMANLGIA